MAKVITKLQWGEEKTELELTNFPGNKKMRAIGDEERIGIVKAYTTRKGKGGFPTEQKNKIGEKICELEGKDNKENGVSYRYGWLDLVMLKDAVAKYEITGLVIDGLDIIGKIGYITPIEVCTTYVHNHIITKTVPTDVENCRPLYETFYGGWDIEKCKRWDNLSDRVKRYIKHIERYVGVPVRYIRFGPNNSHIIIIQHNL